jgi:hypothetical protein
VELVLLHSFESVEDLGLGGSECTDGDGLVELEENALARLGGIGLEVFGERLLLAASEVFGRCVPLRRLSCDIDDRVALVLLLSSEREGV